MSPIQLRSPLRVIQGQARLSYTPYELTGHVVLEPLAPNGLPTSFWVHEWADNYVEVTHDGIQNAKELAELAYDVGVQLGLGHPRSWLPEESRASRIMLKEWFARRKDDIRYRGH
ncbi:MAG: hypothetical protein AAFY60_22425, partial [Myxococcota bacterium]